MKYLFLIFIFFANNTFSQNKIYKIDSIELKQKILVIEQPDAELKLTEYQKAIVDEYKFLINPVFLGSGKTIFKSEEAKSKLKLLDSKKFDNGNIMLHYAADNK